MFDESAWNNMHILSHVKKKVQVGNNQEKAQSDRIPLQKPRWGKNLTMRPLYMYHANIAEAELGYFPNRWPLSYLTLTKNMKTYIRRKQHKKF